ncbi:hypothetical protein GGR50DRAFT_662593 [Xylaria sp. CBS 124048]|nr:hypothetical protein GGR50DRAFT_662593 [Xylaria sp. CBS 124048]
MPLIVPGINNNQAGDKSQEWANKLVGKTVSEDSHSETNFCAKDLPQQSRVISPDTLVTADHQPDRLSIYVNENGTVSHVKHG